MATVAVGVAPYAVCALLVTVFIIGYLAALSRYMWANRRDCHPCSASSWCQRMPSYRSLTLTLDARRTTLQERHEDREAASTIHPISSIGSS